MPNLTIHLQEYSIRQFDTEFEQHYISTHIEYHGRKREVIVLFKDPYEEITIPDGPRILITGELHEHDLNSPLNLIDACFSK